MRHALLLSTSLAALVFAGAPAVYAQMSETVKEAKPAIEKKAEAAVKKAEEAVAPVEEKAEEVLKAAEEKAEATTETVKEEVKEEAAKLEAAAKEEEKPAAKEVKEEAKKEEASTPAPAPVEAVMPPEAPKNYIADALAKDGDIETFMELLKEAGLDTDVLAPASPHTLFIPTDEAFDDLPKGTLDDLRKPENKQKLIDILNLHIVSGSVPPRSLDNNTSEVLTSTLKRLRVVGEKGKFTVNGIEVSDKVTEADDGVIYKINKVITQEAERAALPFAPAPQPPAPGPNTAEEPKAPETATPAPAAEGIEPSPVVAAPTPGSEAKKPADKPWYKFW